MFYNPEKVRIMKTKNYIFALVFIFFSFASYSQTYTSVCRNNLSIAIQDHSTARDSILVNVPSDHKVLDVNILIDTLLHSWDSDLSIYLRKGTIGVKVINNVGGSGDNFIGTLLNDSSGISLPSNGAPFTGTFRPSDSLSLFNNITPTGYWRLVVTDTATGDTGLLKAWCLRIVSTNVSGIIQTVEIPNTFRLYQNYPNPFNPITKIKYGLPKNGNVKLTVYDELGKEVAVLADGYAQANTYEAVFDATNLPSGVYYYKLEAEGFSDTKKMVIIK